MNLIEIIKNPAGFIFRNEKKETRNEIKVPSSNTQNTKSIYLNFVSDWKGFEEAIKTADFHWILRGKTGILIKFVLPVLVVISLVQNLYFQRPVVPIVSPPKIEDLGDILEKPKFVNQNYFTAIQNEEKFYLYSPNLTRTNIFGVRGIVLEEINLPEKVFAGYIPFSKDSYFYFKRVGDGEGRSLQLNFYKFEKILNENTGKYEDKITDKSVNNLPLQFPSADTIFSKTLEGNLIMYNPFDPSFYVVDSNGNLIFSKTEFEEGSKLFTYYKGEIYFIREKDNENYIVKLNSNLQEIFSQQILSNKVAGFIVINADRFLLAYEKPSTKSFYEIEMRDSNSSMIFKFTPDESENKITGLKNIYFEAKNNNVFLLGNGIAKLFTVTGKELWIN